MLSKSLILAALALGSAAQNATQPSYNVTYLEGLANFLGGIGLTSLAQAVQTSINSTGTIALLNNINGTGKTLLAPTNTAFTGFQNLYPNASQPQFLGDVLSYHLISGTLNSSDFSVYPNHTIARTYLNDSAVVQLEGNHTQAIVFSVINNKTQILNQNTNVTIVNTTSYQNLLIQIVDAVVDLPGNFTAALAYYNLTAASTVLTGLNFTTPIQYAKGFTAFVPNDQAFSNANQTISQLVATNITQVQEILANHIVNGSSIYSTEFGIGSATSIGGQSFTLVSNSSGSFVTSGNYTAKVVLADILLDNGVAHIIDTVLLNNASSSSAASSAYSSATAAAATQTAQSGPLGKNAGSSGTGTGSSSSTTKKSSASRISAGQAFVVLAGVLAGAVAVL